MVSSYAAVLQPLLAHHGGLASEHQAAAFVAHLQQGFNTPLARCLACTILQLTPATTCGSLLDAGLLPVLASWLGAAVQLQHDHAALLLQQLLPVLQRLPVDKDAVKACGAGRWLQALAKPHQLATLQAAAQAVKAAWIESVKSNPTRRHPPGASAQKRAASAPEEGLQGAAKRQRANGAAAGPPPTPAAGATGGAGASALAIPPEGPQGSPGHEQQATAAPGLDVVMDDVHQEGDEQQVTRQVTPTPVPGAGGASLAWQAQPAAAAAAAAGSEAEEVGHSSAGSGGMAHHVTDADAASPKREVCLLSVPSAQQQEQEPPLPLRLVQCTLQLYEPPPTDGCQAQGPAGSSSSAVGGANSRVVRLHIEVLPPAAAHLQPSSTGAGAAASCVARAAQESLDDTVGSRKDGVMQPKGSIGNSGAAAASTPADGAAAGAEGTGQQSQHRQLRQQPQTSADQQQQQRELHQGPGLDPRLQLLEQQRRQAAAARFRQQQQAMRAAQAWLPPPRAPPFDPSWHVAAGEGSSQALNMPTIPVAVVAAAAAAGVGGKSASSQPGPQSSPSSPRHNRSPIAIMGDARCPVTVPWMSQQSDENLAAALARQSSSSQQQTAPAAGLRHSSQQQEQQQQQQQQEQALEQPVRLLGPGLLIKPCFPGAAGAPSAAPVAAQPAPQGVCQVPSMAHLPQAVAAGRMPGVSVTSSGAGVPSPAPAAPAAVQGKQQPLEVMRMLQNLLAAGALPRIPVTTGMPPAGTTAGGTPASSLGGGTAAAGGGGSGGVPGGAAALSAGVVGPLGPAAPGWQLQAGGGGRMRSVTAPMGPAAAGVAMPATVPAVGPALQHMGPVHVVHAYGPAAGAGGVPVAVMVPGGMAPARLVAMGGPGTAPAHPAAGVHPLVQPAQAPANHVAWVVAPVAPGQHPPGAPAHMQGGGDGGAGAGATVCMPAGQVVHTPGTLQEPHTLHNVGSQHR